MINAKPVVRILEAHDGLCGLIIENQEILKGDKREVFDGMWSSSLTDSTSKGKPDIEAVDLTTRLQDLNNILECTTKPIIFDGDTGGKIEHFVFTVRTLERHGISAIIIEDKVGLKRIHCLVRMLFKLKIQSKVSVIRSKQERHLRLLMIL